MPEMRTYIVTQVREVKVSANSILDAAQIATIAFEHGQTTNGSLLPGMGVPGMWGNTDKLIREISLTSKVT